MKRDWTCVVLLSALALIPARAMAEKKNAMPQPDAPMDRAHEDMAPQDAAHEVVAPEVESQDQVLDPNAADVSDQQAVLQAVTDYVAAHTRSNAAIAVRDTIRRADRRFSITKVGDQVTREGDLYTVPLEADEVGGAPGNRLFADLKRLEGRYQMVGIRIEERPASALPIEPPASRKPRAAPVAQ